MRLKFYLKEHNISIYQLSKNADIPYPNVYNLVNGKADIKKCTYGHIKKIANALSLSMEELDLLCDKGFSFQVFRSEQKHQMHRKGELDYVIDVLQNKEIDRFWRLSMYAEALYLLASVDHLCKKNDLPLCLEYAQYRNCQLDRPVYSLDTEIEYRILHDTSAYDRSDKDSIQEYKRYNIIEGV